MVSSLPKKVHAITKYSGQGISADSRITGWPRFDVANEEWLVMVDVVLVGGINTSLSYAVKPETICRETGVLVKEDNMIYEHDLGTNDDGETLEVIYSDELGAFVAQDTTNSCCPQYLGPWIHIFDSSI